MLNLNLNIIGANQPKVERAGFSPYTYPDPYSSSLVVAIPGQMFYQGYDPVFGATTPYTDISPFVRGTGTAIPTSATGSNNAAIKGTIGTPWEDYGYTSSLFVPVKAAINAGTSSQFQITNTTEWVVEAWVNFPTASNASGPNHFLMNKVADFGATNAGNSYSVPIVTTTKQANPNDGNYPTNTGPYPLTGSLAMQIFTDGSLINYSYRTLWPASAVTQSIAANTWHHFAVSMNIENYFSQDYAIYRGFVDGVQILEQYSLPLPAVGTPNPPSPANAAPTTPMLLMGNVFDYVQLQLNPIGTPDTWVTQSAAVFQDFRFYNGTNKNYTASFNVDTTVKPIVVARPY